LTLTNEWFRTYSEIFTENMCTMMTGKGIESGQPVIYIVSNDMMYNVSKAPAKQAVKPKSGK